jgi:hypothetical protein
MTPTYITFDHDDGHIARNAGIMGYDSREKAVAALREVNADLIADMAEKGLSPVVTEGQFGDCWIKSTEPPAPHWKTAPFSIDDLDVLRPGQHPGGNSYWVTPRAEILVLTFERAVA